MMRVCSRSDHSRMTARIECNRISLLSSSSLPPIGETRDRTKCRLIASCCAPKQRVSPHRAIVAHGRRGGTIWHGDAQGCMHSSRTSYTNPSLVATGSTIISSVMGHMYSAGGCSSLGAPTASRSSLRRSSACSSASRARPVAFIFDHILSAATACESAASTMSKAARSSYRGLSWRIASSIIVTSK